MGAYSIRLKGRIIELGVPCVMGIINLTDDSFYDKSRVTNISGTIRTCEKMLKEGAKIIDIGAMSSRPGSKAISLEEEFSRIQKAIKSLISEFPNCIFSVDTYRSNVAQVALDEGASIINDISAGLLDKEMFKVVSKFNAALIMMHMQGKPETMQVNPSYENVTKEVFDFLKGRIQLATAEGISEIIVDPGFGFGKTLDQNYKLLNDLNLLDVLNTPILVGLSRKSMIYKFLEIEANEALNGTTALHMHALSNGANILRVHDVKEAVEAIYLHNHMVKLA